MSKVGIIIPVLNNFEGALDLVNSLRTKKSHKVYIAEQWRHQVPLAQAWNEGFDKAIADGADYVFILNDDILFNPDTIDNAIKEYERLKDEGVVLVSCNNLNGTVEPGDFVHTPQRYAPGSVSDHPNYSAFMVYKDFFDKVGRFDESYSPAWCEDQDSHQRITILGLRGICTTAASCIHFGQVTTHKVGQVDSSRSEMYFIRKWGSHHPNPPQAFAHPYNDPNLTAKDWIRDYGM